MPFRSSSMLVLQCHCISHAGILNAAFKIGRPFTLLSLCLVIMHSQLSLLGTVDSAKCNNTAEFTCCLPCRSPICNNQALVPNAQFGQAGPDSAITVGSFCFRQIRSLCANAGTILLKDISAAVQVPGRLHGGPSPGQLSVPTLVPRQHFREALQVSELVLRTPHQPVCD